jgi:hypothetical protein
VQHCFDAQKNKSGREPNVIELLLVWFMLSVVVAIWSVLRGHSGIFSFCVSALLSPLVGFVVEVARGRVAPSEQLASPSPDMKACHACHQPIRSDAHTCRYCGAIVIETDSHDLEGALKSKREKNS